ncbi:MAG: hypothetical protein ACYTDT_09345 [Planctomycetota bacterium]|jgi:hypothetical protein
MQKYAFWACLACIGLIVAGAVFGGELPDASDIHPDVRQQPIQGGYSGPGIVLDHDGHTYNVEPVATYDVTSLIVSENDLDQKWIDEYGLSQDLGMIWGENTIDERFQNYEFSSGSYVLYASVPHGVPFSKTEIGNVHVLPANADAVKALDAIEKGAQVRLQGKLINYTRADLIGTRKSSLTRDDTGMGACEVMLVENVEILSNPNAKYESMIWFGSWGLLGFAIVLIGSTLYIGLTNDPDPRANVDGLDLMGGDEHGSLVGGKYSSLIYYFLFPFFGRWRG